MSGKDKYSVSLVPSEPKRRKLIVTGIVISLVVVTLLVVLLVLLLNPSQADTETSAVSNVTGTVIGSPQIPKTNASVEGNEGMMSSSTETGGMGNVTVEVTEVPPTEATTANQTATGSNGTSTTTEGPPDYELPDNGS